MFKKDTAVNLDYLYGVLEESKDRFRYGIKRHRDERDYEYHDRKASRDRALLGFIRLVNHQIDALEAITNE